MLNIENLSVDYYRRGQVIPAVRDFSFTINPGETVGLVGESGSGKSTVALAILRLIRAQEGRITGGKIVFKGRDLLALPREEMRQVRGRDITMIFQDPFTSLNPVMTIRAQMQEALEAHPASTILADALTRVQLDPDRTLRAYPHQLSGGQRQRVMIAIALLCRPSLVLADEPTTALDVLVQKEILELLFRLQKEMNMGVLLISHNLALIAQYTQRLAVMRQGRIVEEQPSRELFRHPKDAYTQELIRAIPTIPTVS
jgi:ABC-type dipeptide/oligopeptide/nickel transport system ATPase component